MNPQLQEAKDYVDEIVRLGEVPIGLFGEVTMEDLSELVEVILTEEMTAAREQLVDETQGEQAMEQVMSRIATRTALVVIRASAERDPAASLPFNQEELTRFLRSIYSTGRVTVEFTVE